MGCLVPLCAQWFVLLEPTLLQDTAATKKPQCAAGNLAEILMMKFLKAATALNQSKDWVIWRGVKNPLFFQVLLFYPSDRVALKKKKPHRHIKI